MPTQYVTNLRLKFPGATDFVFKDLSLTIEAGEKVLLLGPSGCGKSTLLQVLSGMIPHSLDVPLIYDAIHVPDSWGFVFQDPDTQFCMPYVDEELAFVLENLNVPRAEMDAQIRAALTQVGLTDLAPHTLINSLSQGMKQRLALASVLLLDPHVLYLDEPSALLDPAGTVEIWDTIKTVADDKTVVIVEHKIDQIASWVDRVVLFNQVGEIIADGAPDVIFAEQQTALTEYGIWYPDVWDDYLASDTFQQLMNKRASLQQNTSAPLLTLTDFAGYWQQKQKLHVTEAALQPGSWLAISGANGAGKTTLLLGLMQLIQTSGTYTIHGEAVDMQAKKKRPPEALTLVFQNPELQFIMDTVFDEVAFAYEQRHDAPETVKTQVDALLTRFQLDHAPDRHPFALSTGQKRRLSVATGVTQGADVLLLDEPTFGQDARNTFVMLELLEQLRLNGTTIVMITHDPQITKHFATEEWVIANGALVAIKQPKGAKEDAYVL